MKKMIGLEVIRRIWTPTPTKKTAIPVTSLKNSKIKKFMRLNLHAYDMSFPSFLFFLFPLVFRDSLSVLVF
jgi:hypothetical protein